MHFVKVKGILSQQNGMNLYRGCSHNCIYCDSRSDCYQMSHSFDDIEVKENAVELLEIALKKKRKKCMIGTGSMTDPYIPLEAELGNFRKALELIYHYGYGISLITKSSLILRDIDILKKINEKTKCVVQMTLTTFDEELCRKIEPNVASTAERFDALCKLKDVGIPTVVWLCPILPFINDTVENINGILDYCIKAEVKGVLNYGMGVTLRKGNREYFYNKLDEHFPDMKDKYIKTYGNNYILNSPENRYLSEFFHIKCENNGILHDNQSIFDYITNFEEKPMFEQLKMF